MHESSNMDVFESVATFVKHGPFCLRLIPLKIINASIKTFVQSWSFLFLSQKFSTIGTKLMAPTLMCEFTQLLSHFNA